MQQLTKLLRRTSSKKITTPQYVFLPNELEKMISSFSAFPKNNIQVLFALKANNYPLLVKRLVKWGAGFDIASKEECQHAISLGSTPAQISFSATSKKEEDIKFADKKGVRFFAFDSEIEAKKITKLAPKAALFARLAVHSKDAHFNLSQKYGMDKNYLTYITSIAKKSNLNIKGLSFHVGSQNISLTSWKESFKLVENLINNNKFLSENIEFLNIGGGFPASYHEVEVDIKKYIAEVIVLCKKFRKTFPHIKIIVEPGRGLCASSMALLTRIIDYKPYKNPPTIIVDTGVFHGIVESLEGLEFNINIEHLPKSSPRYYRIGGISCDSTDIIFQCIKLNYNPRVGDVIAITQAGAYTSVMEHFQMIGYPPISRTLIHRQQ